MSVTQVTGRNIKDATVATADIADNAVTVGKLGALTAIGDLLGYTGTAHVRVPVGNDGKVLAADSSTTPGLTWQTVGSLAPTAFKNKLINGNFDFWQRGTSFAAIANTAYSADRWRFGNSSAGVVTISQETSTLPSTADVASALKVTVTTADASLGSGDVMYVEQRIEGYNLRPLKSKLLTLSFWVRSSKTGTYSVALQNSAGDRSLIGTYTINSANTYEFKTVALSHSATGTWDYATGTGLRVIFTLMAGSTFQSTSGTWQGGLFFGTSGSVNFVDTNGGTLYFAQVQLEAGGFATPFEERPVGSEFALCKRYYERSYALGTATGTASLGPIVCIVTNGTLAGSTSGNVITPFVLPYKAEKRAAPTVVMYDLDGTANAIRVYPLDAKRTGLTVSGPTSAGMYAFLAFDATSATAIANGSILTAHWTSDAEL